MQRIFDNIFCFLLTMIIFCSCELTKEIDYKTTGKTDWIVINGFISKEHGVNVLVKKTVSPNRIDDNDIIDKPDVWLHINNKAFARLVAIDQYRYYLPPDSIEYTPGALYNIHVDAVGMESARSGEQQLVSRFEIDTVYVVHDTINWNEKIYIEFVDDTEKDNFYAIKIDCFKDGETDNYFDLNEIVPKYTFTDEGYNFQVKKSFQFSCQDYDSIQVKLYSVSENYHHFLSSFWDYEISYSDYNYDTQYVVETQIENGFGFFASYEVNNYIYKKPIY